MLYCDLSAMEMSAWQGSGKVKLASSHCGCHDVHADMEHRLWWCGIEVLGLGAISEASSLWAQVRGAFAVAMGGSTMGLLISRGHP